MTSDEHMGKAYAESVSKITQDVALEVVMGDALRRSRGYYSHPDGTFVRQGVGLSEWVRVPSAPDIKGNARQNR